MSEWRDCESRDLCDEARAELFKLQQEREWQPIETAPKDGRSILLGFYGGTVVSGCWRRFVDGESGWSPDGSHQNNLKPTAWMPLPKPPTDTKP